MTARLSPSLTSYLLLSLTLLFAATKAAAASYDGFRWFQVEISIFSNEYPEYRDAELWSPERLALEYPEGSREFKQLADFLRLDNFSERVSGNLLGDQLEGTDSEVVSDQAEPAIDPVGPGSLFCCYRLLSAIFRQPIRDWIDRQSTDCCSTASGDNRWCSRRTRVR